MEAKSGVRLSILLLALCAVVIQTKSARAQNNPGVIYAVERDRVEKNFFSLDFSAGLSIEPEVKLVANMTRAAMNDPEFPMQCFGYVSGQEGELYEFSPNGLAYDDSESRLYFAAFDDVGNTSSRLCFYSMKTSRFEFAALLEDYVIGATFDAYSYQYVWIDEGKELEENGNLTLQFAELDRATGQVIGRRTHTKFRDVTSNPNAPATELRFSFRGGDIAIDCLGNLYASSVGTGGGTKAFFTIDLAYFSNTDESTGLAYRLIHQDPNEGESDVSTLTGFATADQLAFDMSGRLFSQDSERGIFSVVNIATGANGELGEEGVDNVILREMGALRRFADLDSSLGCGVRSFCVESEILDPCESRMINMLTPTEFGDVPCLLMEGKCRQPDLCDEEVDCVYYVRRSMST